MLIPDFPLSHNDEIHQCSVENNTELICVASKRNDASLTPSMETEINTQSQHYSEIDDNITPNPSYIPQQQDTGEYEVEMVSYLLDLNT